MFLAFNSDILAEADFHLSADDRAFQYGDGLFETIRYEAGRLWFWPDHFGRLAAGMDALRLNRPAPFSAEALHQRIEHLLRANGLHQQPARVKVQVWRQPGGLYTPNTNDAHVLITTKAGQPFAITQMAKIGIYDAFRVTPSPVSAYKTSNALPYVLAGMYRGQNGFDDVILLDPLGHLAECVASNLFWFRNDTLFTPSLQTGCVNGIARRQLLRAFPDAQEGLFKPAVLDDADTVFAANVAGIQTFGDRNRTRMERIRRIFTATPG